MVIVFLSDNAVINHVGNTVTITNAGTDGEIEFRSSNGLSSNYVYIYDGSVDTFTVTVTDVNGTSNFGTVNLGTSFISNAALTLLSV